MYVCFWPSFYEVALTFLNILVSFFKHDDVSGCFEQLEGFPQYVLIIKSLSLYVCGQVQQIDTR